MKRFAILPLGVGEYFTRRYFNSCFLLFLGERTVLVDCPSPFRRMLQEAGEKNGLELDYKDVEDVIVTHLHGDHSNGLEGLGFWKYYVEKKRPRLYTSPQAMEDLWAKLRGSMSWERDPKTGEFYRAHSLEDYFDVRLWPTGSTQNLHGATFETHLNNHPVPTFGFKVRFDGRTLAYAGDTAFDRDYIEWLSDSDLMIHECNSPPPHTAYEELMSLPESLRAKMRLIHYSDKFDAANSAITPLVQGEIVNIEKRPEPEPVAEPAAAPGAPPARRKVSVEIKRPR